MTTLSNQKVDQIVSTINRLENQLLSSNRATGRIDLATPDIISDTIAKVAVLLQQTVDPMTQLDLDFRRARAARYDKFIREGIKKSPAMDQLKMEQDLIEMEAAVNRINNFVKLTQQTITTFQSNLRVKAGMANGNF